MEEEKITRFTKYEKARMLGSRALQISMGAPLLLKMTPKELEKTKHDPLEMAKKEFEEQIIPLTVKRPFPEVKVEEEKK